MTLKNDLLIDKRIVERNIEQGRLDAAEYQKLLDALPDLSEKVWRRPKSSAHAERHERQTAQLRRRMRPLQRSRASRRLEPAPAVPCGRRRTTRRDSTRTTTTSRTTTQPDDEMTHDYDVDDGDDGGPLLSEERRREEHERDEDERDDELEPGRAMAPARRHPAGRLQPLRALAQHVGAGPPRRRRARRGRAGVNLPLARHTIDMLCMLEEKTRGNLTGEEERLLHQVLFDLRMRFARKRQELRRAGTARARVRCGHHRRIGDADTGSGSGAAALRAQPTNSSARSRMRSLMRSWSGFFPFASVSRIPNQYESHASPVNRSLWYACAHTAQARVAGRCCDSRSSDRRLRHGHGRVRGLAQASRASRHRQRHRVLPADGRCAAALGHRDAAPASTPRTSRPRPISSWSATSAGPTTPRRGRRSTAAFPTRRFRRRCARCSSRSARASWSPARTARPRPRRCSRSCSTRPGAAPGFLFGGIAADFPESFRAGGPGCARSWSRATSTTAPSSRRRPKFWQYDAQGRGDPRDRARPHRHLSRHGELSRRVPSVRRAAARGRTARRERRRPRGARVARTGRAAG